MNASFVSANFVILKWRLIRLKLICKVSSHQITEIALILAKLYRRNDSALAESPYLKEIRQRKTYDDLCIHLLFLIRVRVRVQRIHFLWIIRKIKSLFQNFALKLNFSIWNFFFFFFYKIYFNLGFANLVKIGNQISVQNRCFSSFFGQIRKRRKMPNTLLGIFIVLTSIVYHVDLFVLPGKFDFELSNVRISFTETILIWQSQIRF